MVDQVLMPDIWIANESGDGIVKYDPTAKGHTLDLESDDDIEPVVMPEHVVSILGFDPLQEAGFNTGDAEFEEAEHPRGQPGNAGQFASTASSGGGENLSSRGPMLLTEARREVTNPRATLGSMRRARDRLNEEIIRIRRLPQSSEMRNLIGNYTDKLDTAKKWLSDNGGGEEESQPPPVVPPDRVTSLSPKVQKLYASYIAAKAKAAAIDESDATHAEKNAAWKAANDAYDAVDVQARREIPVPKPVKPGKVVKRAKAPTEDQITDYTFMSANEFKDVTGPGPLCVRKRDGDNASRLLGAVGKTRAAVLSLPKSHRAKLNDVTIINQYTMDASVSAEVESDTGYAGMFYYKDKRAEIVDAVTTRDGSKTYMMANQEHVTLHEIGHALDNEFKFELSNSGYLNEAITVDKKGLTEAQRKAAEYFLTNPREMVAEAYAMCFSTSDRAFGMPKKEAWDAFRNTRERLGALLQQKGLDIYDGITPKVT